MRLMVTQLTMECALELVKGAQQAWRPRLPGGPRC